MRPTAPENFDGHATTDRLDPTWKDQVDSSRLTRPDSQVYHGTKTVTIRNAQILTQAHFKKLLKTFLFTQFYSCVMSAVLFVFVSGYKTLMT